LVGWGGEEPPEWRAKKECPSSVEGWAGIRSTLGEVPQTKKIDWGEERDESVRSEKPPCIE